MLRLISAATVCLLVTTGCTDSGKQPRPPSSERLARPVDGSPEAAWKAFVADLRTEISRRKEFTFRSGVIDRTIIVRRNIGVINSAEPGYIVLSVTSNPISNGTTYSMAFDCFFEWRDGRWQAVSYSSHEPTNEDYFMPVKMLLGL